MPIWLVWTCAISVIGIGLAGIVAWFLGSSAIFVGALGLFVVVTGLGGIVENIRFWRGESPYAHRVEPPDWWVWSPALWRGNVRSTSVVAVGAIPTLGLGALFLAVHELAWPATPGDLPWYPLLRVAVILLWITVPGLGITVILFNRPKAVVPPHLRDQPGMLTGDDERRSRS